VNRLIANKELAGTLNGSRYIPHVSVHHICLIIDHYFVCVYVCMCVCVCVYVCVCECIPILCCKCVWYVWVCMCMYVLFVCIYIYRYVCVCVCMLITNLTHNAIHAVLLYIDLLWGANSLCFGIFHWKRVYWILYAQSTAHLLTSIICTSTLSACSALVHVLHQVLHSVCVCVCVCMCMYVFIVYVLFQ